MPSLTWLTGSDRLPAGVLPGSAWAALYGAFVLTGWPEHPQRPALTAAGVEVTVVDPADRDLAGRLGTAAAEQRVVWLAGPDGDPRLRGATAGAGRTAVELDAAVALPGARLLAVVATMDRLRSPGGCPWDGEQTHRSLAPYLLEEAYEAVEAIDADDPDALREELGDVLLQVVFHARLGVEASAGRRWSIDDVADTLVAKLVRRHPHVFADTAVSGAAEVAANWEEIKRVEKGRRSVTAGVPVALPALALAAALQRKAAGSGVPADLISPAGDPAGGPAGGPARTLAGLAADAGSADGIGELLFAVVALALARGVDPEAALRGRARAFRARLVAAEAQAGDGDVDWRTCWPAAEPER